MSKKFAVFVLATSMSASVHLAEAQQAGKVYRIGVLASASLAVAAPLIGAFRRGLRDLGWVEGQNIAIEGRWAEGKYERLPALAAELVRLKVDVILAITTPGTQAAMNATRTIPIVFTYVDNPVRQGFVASLARPGGNVTGISSVPGLEIFGKRLEPLKDALPNASRVDVLYNPTNPYTPDALREVEIAARALGVELQILEARGPDEFDSAFAAMTRERADALLVLPDGMLFRHRARLAALEAKSRLPTMHGLSPHAEAGALMVYAASFTDLFRRCAAFVDKILKGAKPADLPVERPTKFELWINLKTAKQLGITIPPKILYQATKVIK